MMQSIRMAVPVILVAAQLAFAGAYYVDCADGSDAAPGTSTDAAWRSIEKVSATTFAPGDEILFRRGTRCSGMLSPQGSGEPGRPIRIGSYGKGPLPVIEAGGAESAIRLFNQQGWEIENLETAGGDPYGIHIGADSGRHKHFRIRNTVVRDVTGQVKTKASGLVAILAGPAAGIDDVIVDGVTAFRTTQWAGVVVRGGSRENRARDIIIRNTIVYDIFGDGIILFQVENGLVEKSAAWLTGLEPTRTVGTPNGIWTWRCRNCTVQLTEGFFIDSPGVDGGVYDIDWGNDDNVVQYNYGHDAQGYCASVFGAGKEVTTNSVVRYNVCVNNGRSPKLARRQGDFYISTWDGGALDGVLVHNNTFYWNPPIDVPVLKIDQAEFTGSRPNLFRNNVIYSRVPSMIDSNRSLKFESNVYWYTGRMLPKWRYGGTEYTGFDNYLGAAGADSRERYVHPRLDWLLRPLPGSPLVAGAMALPQMGAHDALGVSLPQGAGFDIGASEFAGPLPAARRVPDLTFRTVEGEPVSLRRRNNRWLLVLFDDPARDQVRSQLVFAQTALAQYGDRNLDAALASDGAPEDVEDLRYQWNLGDVRLLTHTRALRDAFGGASALLVSPTGQVVRHWRGFVFPADLGLTLRHHLGPPAGSPPLVL